LLSKGTWKSWRNSLCPWILLVTISYTTWQSFTFQILPVPGTRRDFEHFEAVGGFAGASDIFAAGAFGMGTPRIVFSTFFPFFRRKTGKKPMAGFLRERKFPLKRGLSSGNSYGGAVRGW
jgi:hypothetical protein